MQQRANDLYLLLIALGQLLNAFPAIFPQPQPLNPLICPDLGVARTQAVELSQED